MFCILTSLAIFYWMFTPAANFYIISENERATFDGTKDQSTRNNSVTNENEINSYKHNPRPKWMWNQLYIWIPRNTTYSKISISNLRKAIAEFQEVMPCLPMKVFEESKGHLKPKGEHLVLNSKTNVCSSSVGRTKRASKGQILSLADWCLRENYSRSQHEIMHSLGWSHEQRRPDRDEYIEILWNNLKLPVHREFKIDKNALAFGPYDINSVMHYPHYHYALGNGSSMISRRNRNQKVGDMGQVTDIDKYKMRGVYCSHLSPWKPLEDNTRRLNRPMLI